MKGNFQIILIVIFIIAAILGVLVFSGAIPLGKDDSNGARGTVTIWGTVQSNIISPLLSDFNRDNDSFSVVYVQKSADTFDAELLEALAAGKGPDLFLITDNLIYKYNNKILKIPFDNFPLSTFQKQFIGAAEIFLTSEGVSAFPLTVDPLMMYYNRSIFDAKGIAYAPTTWDEFSILTPLLTEKDEAGRILKAGVGLGQFSNLNQAKDILAALFMQAGNNIIKEKDGSFYSALYQDASKYDLGSVLKFYTSFADPLNSLYSWNKSFSSSKEAFSSENLAIYFGFASELESLVKKNPNQNFLVATIPQIKSSNFKLTSARIMGLAISAASKNSATAITTASLMSNGDFASKLAEALNIPPVRRDLLGQKQKDAYSPIFYSAAFYAKSWLDPSPQNTDDIFRGMIEKVLANSLSPIEAVRDAGSKLSLLLINK